MTAESAVAVAQDLRWRVARDVLLDPFAWVGGVLLGLVLARVGASLAEITSPLATVAAAPLLTLAVGVGLADALFFRMPENDLLRTQPLGPTGLLEVRAAELGWWLHPLSLLSAAVAWGGAGPGGAVAAWVASRLCVQGAGAIAITSRAVLGASGSGAGMFAVGGAAGGLLAAGHLTTLELPVWLGAVIPAMAGAGFGAGLKGVWLSRYERLASDAAAAPSTPRSRLPRLVARLVPFPPTVRHRLVRDTILLLRGRDGRGAILLGLAPAAALSFRFEPTPTSGQLLWQVLTAAALGGGAIAYAVGPGVHRLRLQVLPWSRTAPRPGSRALVSGLLWGSLWATLHGAILLTVVATVRNGWFAAEVPSLIIPTLAVEFAMVHFSVVFTLSRSTSRGLLGEGMLAIALPAVAVGVALAGVLAPGAIALYPLLTFGMTAEASRRLDQVEVTT